MEVLEMNKKLSTFLETGVYRFEDCNAVFIDPVHVLNRSYSRFRVSPSEYYSRFFESNHATQDASTSRKRKRKKKTNPHTLNERERVADQRHQEAKPLLLKACQSLLRATDLLEVMNNLRNGSDSSSLKNRDLSPSSPSTSAVESFIELGRVWQAPLYEITLKLHPYETGGYSTTQFSERVIPVFNNLISNDTSEDVEAEFMNTQYILPPDSCFYMSDLRQIHNLIPAEKDCCFNLIVIDPPWENGSAYQKLRYPTLPNKYFLSLPIKQLSHTEGALVALWVTNREKLRGFVEEELFPAWGVKYISTFYWLKVKADGSLISDLDLFHHRPYECILLGRCHGESLDSSSRLISIDTTPDAMYQVESTGAVVSLNSAVGLIHFYCSQLPSDRYSILRPEFVMVRHEKPGGPTEYSCKLQLPCNAPFETLEGPICSSMRLAQQAVCLAACKKLHEMGAFTDMLLPDKGSGEEKEKADQSHEGDPLSGTARHREFYPEGVADVLMGEWILSGKEVCNNPKLHLFMYDVKCVNAGYSKDPFLTRVSDFALLFGNELDAEVLSMSMDLFIARTMTTKASLVFRGSIDITQSQLASLKSFHVRLMSIVLDVDVEPSTTPWDPAKAYLFVPVVSDKSVDPIKEIDWDQVEKIIGTDAWGNPLQRARPDVYLGTNERTLGGDRREYGFGKLRHGMAFGQKSHPTYGIRGAVAQFDVVKASGLVPDWGAVEMQRHVDPSPKGKLIMADTSTSAEDLIGRIVTAAHSGKRFYVDSICYDMTAENSFPRKEGYLGPLEYSSYAHYYKQKYGVELMYKQQPLIRGRGVSYCKNLLSPRFEHAEGESDESVDKTYYVFLPPELCLLHPLPGSLVRGAQRLPSIMRRVESMLLAVQLKHMINYPVPASKILEALTAASCQETFCYERAELLGDAYLKWVVSRFLFLKYPQKHEGQLTRMRQQMVSNFVLYQYALSKGLQSYIQADSFSPSRWAAPGVLPVFDEDTKDGESSLFDQGRSSNKSTHEKNQPWDELEDDVMEDGELEGDSSSYRVLSSKTLADVVEALIGVYYVQGGKYAANHLMKWIGIEVEFDPDQIDCPGKPSNIPETVLRNVNFDALEGALNIKFRDRGLLVEAITHASRPSSGVSCYQRLEFVGDAVLDHLITKHLFFTYTNLPPGRLTDLRAAAVNNENFARVAVRRNLHVHLRHGSSALEKQIRDFVKEVQVEFSRPGFNSFGLGDCKAPKVLGDIVESIAGAIFLDAGRQTAVVWKVFEPLLDPMVTPETLPMHPVRELQERCQQQAEGLEYKATRNGNLATVEVFVDGIQVGIAQNAQKKMAQKLAARNALVALKEKESAEAKEKEDENGKKKNGAQTFTRQTLNDICLRRNWPMPFYRCVNEGGPAHAKRFTFAVRVNTTDKGWTDECVGEPMPSVKKAKDSAAVLLLELLNKLYS